MKDKSNILLDIMKERAKKIIFLSSNILYYDKDNINITERIVKSKLNIVDMGVALVIEDSREEVWELYLNDELDRELLIHIIKSSTYTSIHTKEIDDLVDVINLKNLTFEELLMVRMME